jgi:hypothetical protein
MGLLDFYGDPQANMALAAGLLSGGNFGQAMGRGMAGAQAVQMAEQERRLRESQARENEMRAQSYRDKVEAEKANAQRDAQFQQALQSGVPLPQLAQYFPDKVDLLKKLADAPNFGRQSVARTIEGTDEQGRPVTYQVDQFGERIGGGIGQWKAPVQVNQGDRQTFVNPVDLKPMGSFGLNMSPSERDASARGWAGQSLARERLEMDKSGGAEGGKPVWNSELGGFVDPRTRVVMPALDQQGNPLANKGGKLTESESKSTLYLSQMRDASKVLGQIGDATSPMLVAATGNPYTNWIAGETPQKVGQAQRQWAEAYLREKTGAAATAGEVENNIRTFFPVVGDSPGTIEQKRKARAEAEAAMIIPAGRGASRIGESSAQPTKRVTLSDIAETARRSGKSTAEVTAAMRAKGYEIGGN